MQYDVNTPTEYLESLEEDWRKEKLLEVRSLIFSYAPKMKENIRYKMLNFGDVDADNYVFALNAQKHYVSLYVGSIEKIDPENEMLHEFNLGKGCIRIRKTVDLSTTRLEEFIQKTIDLWRADEDVSC